MKLVFMGTPEFAVPSLDLLAKNHEVAAVITAPDKPAGRGKKIQESAVKQKAVSLGIPVLQPANLKDAEFQKQLTDLNADLYVVLAFRMLPETVWSIPKKGTINLHASLLPNYRGAAPINRAIMDGEKITGLTTFYIEKDIDTGMILEQKEMEIHPDEDAGSLHDRMMEKGAELLLSTVNKIEKGELKAKKQKESSELKSAPKIFREDCEIDWTKPEVEIYNHIRGLSPYPAAWTELVENGKAPVMMKIFETKTIEATKSLSPGVIECNGKDRMVVGTGDGAIAVTELQLAGKKRMRTEEFLKGFRWSDDLFFE